MDAPTLVILAQTTTPPPGGGPNPTSTYMLMGLAAAFIVYVAIRPMFSRRKDPLVNSAFRLSVSQQKSIEREMNTLIVELHEMSRKMSAQLDTRAARLEQLIADADQRLAMLKKFGQIEGDLPPQPRPAVTSKDDRPKLRSTSDHQTKPFDTNNIELPDDRPDERYRAIYELADAGLSASTIAQRLSRPAGEIELILALRPRPAGGD